MLIIINCLFISGAEVSPLYRHYFSNCQGLLVFLIDSSNKERLNKFKLYLFYNDYETSYTTYINLARWHRCLHSDDLLVGRNRSARGKPTCLTWWPHDHLTCRRQIAAVRGECVNTAPARQPKERLVIEYIYIMYTLTCTMKKVVALVYNEPRVIILTHLPDYKQVWYLTFVYTLLLR